MEEDALGGNGEIKDACDEDVTSTHFGCAIAHGMRARIRSNPCMGRYVPVSVEPSRFGPNQSWFLARLRSWTPQHL